MSITPRAIQIVNSQLTTDGSTNTLTLYNAQVTVTNSAPNTNVVTLADWRTRRPTTSWRFFNACRLASTATNASAPIPFLTLGGSTLAVSNKPESRRRVDAELRAGHERHRNRRDRQPDPGRHAQRFRWRRVHGHDVHVVYLRRRVDLQRTVTIGATPNTNFTYTVSTNTAGQVNLIVALPVTPPVASFTRIRQRGRRR
jgi:hypothetical protein